MLTVSSIGHVDIRVREIARSRDFYVGKLGFAESGAIARLKQN